MLLELRGTAGNTYDGVHAIAFYHHHRLSAAAAPRPSPISICRLVWGGLAASVTPPSFCEVKWSSVLATMFIRAPMRYAEPISSRGQATFSPYVRKKRSGGRFRIQLRTGATLSFNETLRSEAPLHHARRSPAFLYPRYLPILG